jgi:hypothetical protein
MESNQTPAASRADSVKRYLLRNPAVAVTLLYLLTTAIGVSYAYLHYAEFGIAIFDYWQPSDLVLAGFREPASFALAIVFIWYMLWAYRDTLGQRAKIQGHVARYEQLERAGRLGWYQRVRLGQFRRHLEIMDKPVSDLQRFLRGDGRDTHAGLFVFLGVFMFLLVANMHIGIRGKFPHQWFPTAELTMLPDARAFADPKQDPQFLIGASNSYLFLSAGYGREVTIVPLSSVLSLRVHEPAGRWWERFKP